MQSRDEFVLDNGSRVAVLGGGPAGSLFSYFLLVFAERAEKQLEEAMAQGFTEVLDEGYLRVSAAEHRVSR